MQREQNGNSDQRVGTYLTYAITCCCCTSTRVVADDEQTRLSPMRASGRKTPNENEFLGLRRTDGISDSGHECVFTDGRTKLRKLHLTIGIHAPSFKSTSEGDTTAPYGKIRLPSQRREGQTYILSGFTGLARMPRQGQGPLRPRFTLQTHDRTGWPTRPLPTSSFPSLSPFPSLLPNE